MVVFFKIMNTVSKPSLRQEAASEDKCVRNLKLTALWLNVTELLPDFSDLIAWLD